MATRAAAGDQARLFLFVPTLGVALVAMLTGVRAGLLAAAVTIGGVTFLFATLPLPHELVMVRVLGVAVVAALLAWAIGSLRSTYRREAEERAAAQALAEQLSREKERAERAVTARDEVLALVSHDLKNPLAAIVTTADLLERRCDARAPELARHARTIRENALGANRLIGDLLDAASIEAGRLSIDVRPAAVDAVAQEAVDRIRPLAEAAGVALALQVPDGRLEVACDPDRILQVLSNLIGNAVKATPRGGTIRVSVDSSPGEVRLVVTDDGVGIDPADLPHLFDRFRRGSTARYAGSGLGLAIARGIVEAHGGSIAVESAPGRGARFSLTLPYGGPADAAPRGPPAPGEAAQGSPP
jgi:signal transduction histidine kinase